MAVKTKGKIVSIVINNEFVKICEVTKQGKNVIIHKAITIPTPENCYKDGVIDDIDALAKAMKIVMDENRFSSNNVAFSISSTRLATKEVLIPSVNSNRIEKIVQANATEYFPVNMDEYLIQHTVLEKVDDQGQEKIKLLVAAIPSEVVESYYDLAKRLGLKVAFVDYAGNSTYQLMRQQIGEEVSLVIQVENDATVVNIFNGGVLQLQRIVPYGKSLLVNAVMEKFGLKYEASVTKLQAETLLHSRFDGDEVTESVRYLVGNINRIIDYFVSRNHMSIAKAYLIGHSTSVKGFATLLSNEMNMQLIKVESLRNVSIDKKTYVEASTITSYVTNLGAVIDPVDFIPKSLAESGQKKANTKNVLFMFIGAVAVSALLVLLPLGKFVVLQAETASLNSSIKKLSAINPIVDAYYEAKDKYSDAESFKALTVSNDDNALQFIEYLEKNVPSDVVLSTMTFKAGSVTLTGTCSSKSSVAKLIQQLEKSNVIANVDVPNFSEIKDAADIVSLSFSLTCSFSGNPMEGASK